MYYPWLSPTHQGNFQDQQQVNKQGHEEHICLQYLQYLAMCWKYFEMEFLSLELIENLTYIRTLWYLYIAAYFAMFIEKYGLITPPRSLDIFLS